MEYGGRFHGQRGKASGPPVPEEGILQLGRLEGILRLERDLLGGNRHLELDLLSGNLRLELERLKGNLRLELDLQWGSLHLELELRKGSLHLELELRLGIVHLELKLRKGSRHLELDGCQHLDLAFGEGGHHLELEGLSLDYVDPMLPGGRGWHGRGPLSADFVASGLPSGSGGYFLLPRGEVSGSSSGGVDGVSAMARGSRVLGQGGMGVGSSVPGDSGAGELELVLLVGGCHLHQHEFQWKTRLELEHVGAILLELDFVGGEPPGSHALGGVLQCGFLQGSSIGRAYSVDSQCARRHRPQAPRPRRGAQETSRRNL